MGRRAFAAEFKREAVKAALQPGLERLRRGLKQVTTEHDILKKAVGYFAKEPK